MAENDVVKTGSSLFSISLDLSGSTLAKQTIVLNSIDDQGHRKELYGQYLSMLFSVEATFYRLVRLETDLDLARLFLVKGIGDELWYLYPVDPGDEIGAQRAAAALMNSLLGTLGKHYGLSVPSRRVADSEGSHQSTDVRWTRFDLPLKACIDLVRDATELNLERFDRLGKQVAALAYEIETDTVRGNELTALLYNNFNLAGAALNENKITTSIRTDYVGLEIDRFFRISRFCRPRLLAVGDTLIRALDHTIEPIGDIYDHLDIKVLAHRIPRQDGSGLTIDRKNVITEHLEAHDLKGVGERYDLHHVFGVATLGQSAFMPLPGVTTLMEPTRSFLGEKGYYALPPEKRLP